MEGAVHFWVHGPHHTADSAPACRQLPRSYEKEQGSCKNQGGLRVTAPLEGAILTAVHRAWGNAVYPEGPLISPGKPPRSITNQLRLPPPKETACESAGNSASVGLGGGEMVTAAFCMLPLRGATGASRVLPRALT